MHTKSPDFLAYISPLKKNVNAEKGVGGVPLLLERTAREGDVDSKGKLSNESRDVTSHNISALPCLWGVIYQH